MKKIKYFFECYYRAARSGIFDLDLMLAEFMNTESKECQFLLKSDLKDIIENTKYEKASYVLSKEAGVGFSFGKTELILKYIYAKLCDQPTEMTLEELIKRLKK